jgi:hypothetical protein
MRHTLVLSCLALCACGLTRIPAHYVPPEEAAWYKLPHELPTEGRKTLTGPMVTAIQLAMDDFLPHHTRPHWNATPQEICLYQRQSYDVHASPSGNGVMLVRITTHPGACRWGKEPVADMGSTYAVDTRNWRILAVQRP